MELRQYWQIVRRRLWVVLGPFLIVLAIGLLQRAPAAQGYQANMRFLLGLEPEVKTGDYYTYDKYYTWLTSEYLIDDTSELVRSKAFAEAVSAHLASQGIQVPAGAIQGSTQAGQLHRILTVSVGWGGAKELGDIANAAKISKGALYYYFSSKHEILYYILRKYMEAYRKKGVAIVNLRAR